MRCIKNINKIELLDLDSTTATSRPTGLPLKFFNFKKRLLAQQIRKDGCYWRDKVCTLGEMPL